MASAAQTLPMSVEEYLSTTFRPDVDYVDGYIEERNVGEMDHGTVQGVLYALFLSKRTEWKIWPALETRVQVSSRRFRVPDVAVVSPEARAEQIIRTPPLLCVEVLSPEDTMQRTLGKIREYFDMGVPAVWIIEPRQRSLTACLADGSKASYRSGSVFLAETAVEVNLDELFSILDEK